MEKTRAEYYPKNRAAWRKWLEKNHASRKNVWLIVYKKGSNKPTITYDDAVEEALCFGWIDGTANKRDDESSYRLFAQRKTKSTWSGLNKTRIEKLVKENKMTDAGLQKITAAKKDGSWEILNKIEALEMPYLLKKAFTKNKTAMKNFMLFPPSAKKQLYFWVENAKTDTTRQKRIDEIVSHAEKNIRANQWTAKAK
jgi:uncharacterized protein YdeI (YjbR/CyaY-like superfamily)